MAWFIQSQHRFRFANSNGETDINDVTEQNTDIFCHQTYTITHTQKCVRLAGFKNVNVETRLEEPERGGRHPREK